MLDANIVRFKEEWLILWKLGWEGIGVVTRETEKGRIELSLKNSLVASRWKVTGSGSSRQREQPRHKRQERT